MSDSPQTKIPSDSNTEAKVQFKSDNIGQWASKQENPFAEQNRKTQAKRQRKDEQRKKSAPFIIGIVSVIAVAIGVLGLVLLVISLRGDLPDDIALGSDGATEIQDQAQAVYDKFMNSDNEMTEAQTEEALKAVNDFFNNKGNLTSDEKVKAEVALLEMAFYSSNAQPQAVLNMSDKVNESLLSEIAKSQYYGMLMNAAFNVGDEEQGQYYAGMLEEASSADNEDVEG